jgi:hypothetical protein
VLIAHHACICPLGSSGPRPFTCEANFVNWILQADADEKQIMATGRHKMDDLQHSDTITKVDSERWHNIYDLSVSCLHNVFGKFAI